MGYNYNDPYQGGDPYSQQRKQATDAAQGAGAQGLDAITRRYAAMGGLNSGAYANAVQQNTRDTQGATESAIGDLNSRQAQAAQQAGEFGAQQAQQASQFQQQQGQQGTEFAQQLGQQGSQFSQELPLKQQQLTLEGQQQANDLEANRTNADLARQQLGQSGGLFGGGGFLGTGLSTGFGGGGGGSLPGAGLGSLLGGAALGPVGAVGGALFGGGGGFHF